MMRAMNFAACGHVGGALSATANSGNITQSGAVLAITGVTTIRWTVVITITLTDTSNGNFQADSGANYSRVGNVSWLMQERLPLGCLDSFWNLAVTLQQVEMVTDSGALAITGTSTFTVANGLDR